MSERVNSTYLELITGPGGWVVIKAIYLLRRLEQVSELFEVGDEEIRCVKPSYTVVKLVSEFARPLYKLTQPFFESFQCHCLVHSASATRKDIDFMNKIQSTCFFTAWSSSLMSSHVCTISDISHHSAWTLLFATKDRRIKSYTKDLLSVCFRNVLGLTMITVTRKRSGFTKTEKCSGNRNLKSYIILVHVLTGVSFKLVFTTLC